MATAKIAIYASFDDRGLEKAKRDLAAYERQIKGSSTAASSSWKRMGGVMTGTTAKIGSSMAALGLTRWLKGSLDAAATAQESIDSLANAIQNTGVTYESTSKQVDRLLASQSELSAYSKGTLRDALTQLVTTTHDAGRSMNLMTVTEDLARRKHMDLSQAAVLVGKAWNGNSTSLKRLGIELPKGTKGMAAINALQQRVAGSAEAYGKSTAGAQEKFRNSLKALQVTIGTALLPIVAAFAGRLRELITGFQKLPGPVQNVIIGLGAFVGLSAVLAPWIANLKAAALALKMDVLWTKISSLWKRNEAGATGAQVIAEKALWAQKQLSYSVMGAKLWIQETAAKISNTASTWANTVSEKAGQAAKKGGAIASAIGLWIRETAAKVANTAATIASRVAQAAGIAVTYAMAAAQWALNVAMSANPIGLVVIAIAALIAIFVVLWNKNKAFHDFIVGVWNAIKNAAVSVWNWLVNAFKNYGTWIVAAITGPIGWLVIFLVKNWDKIKAGAVTAWNGVLNFLKSIPGKIVAAFQAYVSFWLNIGRNIVEGIKNGISNAWNALVSGLKDKVSGVVDSVKSWLGINSPSRVFHKIGKNMTEGMANGIKEGKEAVGAAAAQLAGDAVTRSYTALAAAIKADPTLRKKMIDSYNSLMGITPDSKDPAKKTAKKKTDTLADTIKAATAKLKDAVKAYRDQIKAIGSRASDLMSSWGLDEIAGVTMTSAEKLMASLQTQFDTMAAFSANIAKLKKMGIASGVVASLLAAGPAQAAGQAQAFASMTADQVSAYNSLWSQQAAQSKSLALTELGAPTKPSITISKDAVKVEVHVAGNASEEDISNAVNKAFKKLLKEIKS